MASEEQKNKLNNSNGWYVMIIPDEGTYGKDGKDLIEYNIHLISLNKPIYEWFKEVWAVDTTVEEEAREKFIDTSLDLNKYQATAFGIHTIVEEEFGEIPPPNVTDTYSLFPFIKENLSVEGPVNQLNYAVTAITTMEFDYAYAFFVADALKEENGLGPILSPYVKLNEDSSPVLTQSKVVLSAYLT